MSPVTPAKVSPHLNKKEHAMKSTPDMNEVFISVDIEADGPIPGDYSMIALGAKVIGYGEEEFYAELAPISRLWNPDALKVSGFSRQRTLSFDHPALAITGFVEWLEDVQEQHGGRLVMVGFNAPFDWSFVNYYLHHFCGHNPLGISVLDIKAMYLGLTGCSWRDTSMSRLPEELRPQDGLSHNALEDARDQARIFELLQERIRVA